MKSQYLKVVNLICGDNWNTSEVSLDERDGGYGVAIVLACLQRVNPRLNDLSEAIGTPHFVLEMAYRRLQVNGVISYGSEFLKDTSLVMTNARTEEELNAALKSWCHIAGIASGFVGVRVDRVQQKVVANGAV